MESQQPDVPTFNAQVQVKDEPVLPPDHEIPRGFTVTDSLANFMNEIKIKINLVSVNYSLPIG